ncbi:hypothetical protein B0T25DRAFT_571426 [Lasiosphaeria hispida]|uniref:Integral membrane protein n=1 Tax=Lasiosphaeria hispida TaxID=260671 RepID=A0AAJ0MAH1_9PEZI|nr:hypothetical protein B0T25DRAFT_571426 [Lasiosphaeria hispida]
MKTLATSFLTALASVAALGFIPVALAHGDDMNMEKGEADMPLPDDQYPPTYFALSDHRAVIYSHIAAMTLAWVFMLPAVVMLSLSRSRYTLAAQSVFLATNAGGVLLGTIYNASTSDLYPNNAHHKLGWMVTWVVGAQVTVGLLARVGGILSRRTSRLGRSHERQSFIPVSTKAMAEHDSRFAKDYRFSNDSGQGTEPNSESLASPSSSPGAELPSAPLRDIPLHEAQRPYDDDDMDGDEDPEAGPPKFPGSGKAFSVAQRIAGMVSTRFWKILFFAYNFVDRTILILGFIAFCTGIITFGRFFEGDGIFSGLAHWIKGGIFFWLGIFTLGRWAGSFGDLGWAWNVRPKAPTSRKWQPSAEFAESALIFTYGATNIFLEHLGNWGGEWSAQDLEHVSITVLFIGGGLFGMLVESTRVRDLLNTTVTEAAQKAPEHVFGDKEHDELRDPETYPFSMNPIPALVILLLGIMMSSHTQESMISSMVHKQWGQLLTGASFARGFSYVLTYLKPPKSIYPSRPPTEILTSFGLISGGIIFMASSSDTVDGMIHYQLDAMFMYTVTMGFVGLLMAWVILVVALKGWAVRRESSRPAAGSLRSV